MQLFAIGCMVFLTTSLFAQQRQGQTRFSPNISIQVGPSAHHRPMPPRQPVYQPHHHHCDHPSHYRGHSPQRKGHGHSHGHHGSHRGHHGKR